MKLEDLKIGCGAVKGFNGDTYPYYVVGVCVSVESFYCPVSNPYIFWFHRFSSPYVFNIQQKR